MRKRRTPGMYGVLHKSTARRLRQYAYCKKDSNDKGQCCGCTSYLTPLPTYLPHPLESMTPLSSGGLLLFSFEDSGTTLDMMRPKSMKLIAGCLAMTGLCPYVHH